MPGVVFLNCEIIQFWKGVYYIIRTEELAKSRYVSSCFIKKGLAIFQEKSIQCPNLNWQNGWYYEKLNHEFLEVLNRKFNWSQSVSYTRLLKSAT